MARLIHTRITKSSDGKYQYFLIQKTRPNGREIEEFADGTVA